MKITPQPTGIGTVALRNALVVIDSFHRQHLGLDFVEDSCEVTGTWPSSFDQSLWKSLVLVETRPERIEEFLRSLPFEQDMADRTAWCVFPKNHAHLVDWVVTRESIASLAIRDYVVDPQIIALEIGQCQDGDLDANTLFKGIKLGMELTGQNITTSTSNQGEIEARQHLISLAESLDLVEFKRPEDELLMSVEEVAQVSDEKSKQYIAELEGKVVTLNRKLDALQRKYDALANSKLGKIILTRWEKNREISAGETK